MDVGSAIATPVAARADGDGDAGSAKTRNIGFDGGGGEVQLLEGYIDAMDARLPPLKNFILPSGGHAGGALRCTARPDPRSRPGASAHARRPGPARH